MTLAMCQSRHIFCCWVEPSLLLSSFLLLSEKNYTNYNPNFMFSVWYKQCLHQKCFWSKFLLNMDSQYNSLVTDSSLFHLLRFQFSFWRKPTAKKDIKTLIKMKKLYDRCFSQNKLAKLRIKCHSIRHQTTKNSCTRTIFFGEYSVSK